MGNCRPEIGRGIFSNGLVAPVIPYGVKGFIWNQGESDSERPFLYEKMFQQLIMNWRKLWKQDDLSFLFVQSSKIAQSHEFEKKTCSSCLIREAQQKALSLPHTGMVVSIDIGDSLDVHPKNKKDFGHRLALQALKIAYHQEIIADGPFYESFEIKGDTVIVKINDRKSPLKKMKDQTLSDFEIASKDGSFHDAKAYLRNNKVYVLSENVKNPLAVRYAWSDNPWCCLFNEAGLPLAPFSTGNK
jgi:sialate O-acetylesterase